MVVTFAFLLFSALIISHHIRPCMNFSSFFQESGNVNKHCKVLLSCSDMDLDGTAQKAYIVCMQAYCTTIGNYREPCVIFRKNFNLTTDTQTDTCRAVSSQLKMKPSTECGAAAICSNEHLAVNQQECKC